MFPFPFERLSFFNCQTKETCKGQNGWSMSLARGAFKGSSSFKERCWYNTHVNTRCEGDVARVTTKKSSTLSAKSSENKTRVETSPETMRTTLWRSRLLFLTHGEHQTTVCLYTHSVNLSTCTHTKPCSNSAETSKRLTFRQISRNQTTV